MVYLKDSNIKIERAEDVEKVFQDVLALEDPIEQDKEHFYVMHLTIRNQIKMVELVNVGVLTFSPVHPRETFRRAAMAGSAAIIIAHNHPSGEADPSDEDTKLTKHIFEVGKILGIDMLDHIIFTKDRYFSFKKNTGGEIAR